MKFLREMLERASAVNLKVVGIAMPKSEVFKGEEVLGTLSDDLKRLYVAMMIFNKEVEGRCENLHAWAEELTKKVEGGQVEITPADRLKLQEHTLDHEKVGLFRKLFWNAVRGEFSNSVIQDGNLALREDWQVVTYSDLTDTARSLQSLADLLMEE